MTTGAVTLARLIAAHPDLAGEFEVELSRLSRAEAENLRLAVFAADPTGDKQKSEAPLATLCADVILKTVWPEPVWAIPGVLPAGLGILAGAPKVGKSWLALQFAQAIAAGGRALGAAVKQGPVLYLALEDSPARLQSRMLKQGWIAGLPVDFVTLGQFAQVGDLRNGGGEKLARQIEARGYRLAIIDTLSRAIGGDQNAVDEMTKALTPLQETAHAQNCAILLCDHHRKGGGFEPDTIADILGSTAKGAMVDTALGLYRERGKVGARLSMTGREIGESTLALTFDGLTGCWQCDGDADVLALTERRQEIIDALGEIGRPATAAQVAKMIGQDRANTFKRLQDLTNSGLVKRLAEPGKAPLYALQ